MTQCVLFAGSVIFLFISILFIFNRSNVFEWSPPVKNKYNGVEEFDPSLKRLSSISKLAAYCDSLYANYQLSGGSGSYEEVYPEIASEIARERFYHGYSRYSLSDNYMAVFLKPLTGLDVDAIVIPDDILKFPWAACSQQSLVMMELMRRKGFTTRKVGFATSKRFGGHFSFEVYYDNSWHYFDPNQEPDRNVLLAYKRPSIEFLASHPDILRLAYNRWDSVKVADVLMHYTYGKPSRFEAPNALLFQQITKFLCYTFWLLLFGAFLLTRYLYLKLNPGDKTVTHYQPSPVHTLA